MKRKIRAKVIVFFALGVACSSFPYASEDSTTAEEQTPEAEKQKLLFRLSGGIGLSTLRSYNVFGPPVYGLAGGYFLSYQDNHDVFSVRFVYSDVSPDFSPPEEIIWDIGVLYGWATRSKWVLASVSGGIGFVGGKKRGGVKNTLTDEYEMVTRRSLGLLAQMELAFTPLPFLGFGGSVFGNLNFDKSFAGVFLVSIYIGKLR